LSRAKNLGVYTTKELFDLAANGNKKALAVRDETGFYLGVGIANVINILNPDIIVMGGQISNAWPYFNEKMEDTINKRALFNCKIAKSRLINAGILGAALLKG